MDDGVEVLRRDRSMPVLTSPRLAVARQGFGAIPGPRAARQLDPARADALRSAEAPVTVLRVLIPTEGES